MKATLNFVKTLSKMFLLVLLLIFGWAFLNASNLVKGKKHAKNGESGSGDLFGANNAYADVPQGGELNCPHIAYYDGKDFRVENDFLPGDFKKILPGHPFLKHFRNASPTPDLLKLTETPQRYGGKLALRLQEIELEESFVNWVKLIRLVHPEKSEVIVDSQKKIPYVVDAGLVTESVILPEKSILNGSAAVDDRFSDKASIWKVSPAGGLTLFQAGDAVEFYFRGLNPDEPLSFIVKSAFRDWMAGESAAPFAVNSGALFSNLVRASAAVALSVFLMKKGIGDHASFLPIIWGVSPKSIIFSFQNSMGRYVNIAVHKPRGFKESVELLAMPREAVRSDGTAVIRAEFTKRHSLSFIGAVQSVKTVPHKEEILAVKRATHSRLGDAAGVLSGKTGEYTHLIPGDTVHAEFEEPALKKEAGEIETYLFQSSGFYTGIRPEYKKLAGNWTEKLTPEARAHYRTLAALNNSK